MPKPRHRLSPRQRRFLEEYFVDFSAHAAWRRAFGETGERPGNNVYRELRRPAVDIAVQTELDERAAQTRIMEARVVAELERVAFSHMRQVADWGHKEDGKPFLTVKDAKDLKDADAAAVAEVALTPSGLRIKLHDKQAALLALVRRLDIIAERLALRAEAQGGGGQDEGAGGEPRPATAAELARELRGLPREAREAIRAILLQHQIIDVTPTVKEEEPKP